MGKFAHHISSLHTLSLKSLKKMAQSMNTSIMATKFVVRTSGVHTSRVRVSPRLAGARVARVQARKNMAVRCDVPEPVVISEEAKAEAEEKKDVLDPADGSVAYGGPMGEGGTENLNAFG